jgi:hypothetical protein
MRAEERVEIIKRLHAIGAPRLHDHFLQVAHGVRDGRRGALADAEARGPRSVRQFSPVAVRLAQRL